MTKKAVTLKDIASRCELAPTTVSRILNGKSTYCSEAKIALVRKLAEELNYRPNIGYRIMTGSSTNIAAVIFSQMRLTQDDHVNQLYIQLCAGLEKQGFALYTSIMNADIESQKQKLRELDACGCRYYIFIGIPTGAQELQDYLMANERSFISYNGGFSPRNISLDLGGMYLEYLRLLESRGITNFKIAVTEDFMVSRILPRLPEERRSGFCNKRLSYPLSGIMHGDTRKLRFRAGYNAMEEELKQNPGIQAMLFPSDFHVYGAAHCLAEHAGHPVELFGMHDAVASQFTGLKFTTARFDMEKAASLLISHLRGQEVLDIMLSGEIVHYGNGI